MIVDSFASEQTILHMYLLQTIKDIRVVNFELRGETEGKPHYHGKVHTDVDRSKL